MKSPSTPSGPSLLSSTPVAWPWVVSLPSLPTGPGVYWFLDATDKVLYVGKAKNLKSRVHSYRHLDKQTAPKTHKLVSLAAKLKYTTTDTELDALILEAELIRLHQPKYNSLLKDDKSPLYIYLTPDPFPRLKTTHKTNLGPNIKKSHQFGPYPSGYQAKKLLRFIRLTFGYCDASPSDIKKGKACFYYHLDQCPGPCQGQISQPAYHHHLQAIKKILRGQKASVIRDLKHQLAQAVSQQNFELASIYRDRLQLLNHPQSTPPSVEIDLPNLTADQLTTQLKSLGQLIKKFFPLPANYPLNRLEAYDISNISGKQATGSMVVFTSGQPDPSSYRRFQIKYHSTPNDPAMLVEVLSRRLKHQEWGIPNLIIIDGGRPQLQAARKTIPWNIPLVSLAKRPDRLMIYDLLGHLQTIPLTPRLPASRLLTHLRDESHRFAKAYHLKLRHKHLIQ